MSESQVIAFLNKIKEDQGLAEKVKKATDSSNLASIAKEAGFDVTSADLDQIKSSSALSDKELETVSGGGGGCIQVMNTTVCTPTGVPYLCG